MENGTIFIRTRPIQGRKQIFLFCYQRQSLDLFYVTNLQWIKVSNF